MEIQFFNMCVCVAGLVHWSGFYYVARSDCYIIETSRTVCLPPSSSFRGRITEIDIVKSVTYRKMASQTHEQCA